jgi:uncharacterized protein (DUF2267 family)
MADRFHVKGGVGGLLPGALGPADLDARLEWVRLRPGGDLLDALAARLGSEADLYKVVLAVLAPLRASLEGEPLRLLFAKLPQDLSRQLADAEQNLCAHLPAPSGAGDYLVDVSRLVQHPPRRAATYVRAVFASAKDLLAHEGSEAIAARLPPELADLWRSAR